MSTTKKTTLYKVLADGRAWGGGTLEYSLPDGTTPGDWHDIDGPLVRCKNGLHLTTDPARLWQRGREVYTVETRGELMGPAYDGDHEYVARSLRLVHRLTRAEMDALAIGVKTRRKVARYAPARSKYAPKGASPGYLFVEMMWTCAQVGGARQGWAHFNQMLHAALLLAIRAGMEFNAADIGSISEGMRGSYWFGESENIYAAAVTSGNTSACLSYEAWRGRKPFLWDGTRLYTGADLPWDGRRCSVTSFDDGAGTFIACAYHPQERDEHGHAKGSLKVAKRYTVTREAFGAAVKEQKTTAALAVRMAAMHKRLSKIGVLIAELPMRRWTADEWTAAEAWIGQAEMEGARAA